MAQYDLSIEIQGRLTDADQLSDAIGLPVSSLSAEVTLEEPKDNNKNNKNKNNYFYIYWVIFGSILTIIVIVVVS